jgi:small subunit ribosomal protein S16
MAVKIRLSRRGRKKLAIFDIIIADARSPRDGKIIEKIGTYNPNINPAQIILDETKSLEWLMQGAQPTDTVRAILSYKGVLFRKHLQIGVNKKAITQEEADKKFNAWLKEKEAKINKKIESIETSKKEADKKKLEDEKVTNKKRLDKIKQKLEEAPAEEVKKEAPTEEVKKEAPTEEVKKEAPAKEAKEKKEKDNK